MSLRDKILTFKEKIIHFGPVATNMNFYQDLDRYKKGIYIYDRKSREEGGHWVVVVGWKDDAEVKNGGYWICRNSWGEKWGENGYFRIAYGECGIDDYCFVYGIF
jgi:C1A family cysteine protease